MHKTLCVQRIRRGKTSGDPVRLKYQFKATRTHACIHTHTHTHTHTHCKHSVECINMYTLFEPIFSSVVELSSRSGSRVSLANGIFRMCQFIRGNCCFYQTVCVQSISILNLCTEMSGISANLTFQNVSGNCYLAT